MSDDPDDDCWCEEELPQGLPFALGIEVTETENPVVAVIYDGAGDILTEIHERPVIPFGFCR